MNADELDPKAVTHKSEFQDPITVERANFSWEGAENVSLSLPPHFNWHIERKCYCQAFFTTLFFQALHPVLEFPELLK